MIGLRRWPQKMLLVTASAALGIAYTFRPLYASNQNHKFLIGLAKVGFGSIDRDWLIGTADPIPAFSFLVETTYRALGEWPFYLEFLLLMIPYLAGLLALFEVVGGDRAGANARWTFVTAVIVVHSALLGDLTSAFFRFDLRDALTDGLAYQSILDHYLQPSLFGVFLVLSVARFAQNKPWQAMAFAAIPPAVHFTYFIMASVLASTYLVLLIKDDRRVSRRVVALSLLYGLAIAPTLLYTLRTFGPSSPDMFQRAQHILAVERIPHHCVASRWFDEVALFRLAWVLLALGFVWGTRLFTVLTVSLLVSASLSTVQIVSGSDSLALLFPWRASTLLVPVATAIILSRLILTLSEVSRGPGTAWLLLAHVVRGLLLVLVTFYGADLIYKRFQNDSSVEFRELTRYVCSQRSTIQTFVVPIERGHGEIENFRTRTRVPVYVDFKSHPYKDSEVLEWSRRVAFCDSLYRELRHSGQISPQAGDELRRMKVTHLLWQGAVPPYLSDEAILYRNQRFAVVDLEKLLPNREEVR